MKAANTTKIFEQDISEANNTQMLILTGFVPSRVGRKDADDSFGTYTVQQ